MLLFQSNEVEETNVPEDLSQYEQYAELLKFNPNIILFGPPGTGKTYGAMRIIECFDNQRNSGKFNDFKTIDKQGRVKFVTFHQAYSYEEFIEGIRPQISKDTGTDDESTNNLTYVIEDGIIKRLANSASRYLIKTEVKSDIMDNVRESSRIWKFSLGSRNKEENVYKSCKKSNEVAIGFLYNQSINGMTYGEIYAHLEKLYKPEEGKPKVAADCLNIFLNEMNRGDLVLIYDSPTTIRDIGVIDGDYFYQEKDENPYPHRRKVVWIKEFKEPANILDYNLGTRLTLKTVYELSRINLSDLSKIIKESENDKTQKVKIEQKEVLPYYLIIDEINRGNIAKIFGELITLIEKDKREKISCYLPYSKKPFTLPPNLYIIGTMNTADRSIAVLDTALRRRFAFIEIEPDLKVFDNPSLVASAKVNGRIDIAQLLAKLNEKITEKLDRDHRIGHSYFMNIVGLNDLYKVWYYKIIPLLSEYFFNDIESLKSLIGEKFFEKNGSVVFLNKKNIDGNISDFEYALFRIFTTG